MKSLAMALLTLIPVIAFAQNADARSSITFHYDRLNSSGNKILVSIFKILRTNHENAGTGNCCSRKVSSDGDCLRLFSLRHDIAQTPESNALGQMGQPITNPINQ